jgi:competence protein ComFC
LRERGFNQAQLLAEEISKLDGGTNFGLEKDVLKRPKDSEHQAHIKDKKGRLKNASGAFAVNNIESVKGKNIILIDDVVTTGATLHEAKRVLRQAGAKKVVAFTVAH